MFSYEVLTEEEALKERFNILPDGDYDAVVIAAENRLSSNSGNPMIDITLQVFDENGSSQDVRDFIVFTKKMMWKVIHFATSANLMEAYQDQKLSAEVVIGSRVTVKIKTESGGLIPDYKLKGKLPGARYPDKNKVDDYIKTEGEKRELKPNKLQENEILDKDVPF